MNDRIPALSIGMPVFNGAKYIREAIDSLLAQTFTDFELIISDNASIDATQEICEEYVRRDPRTHYVRQGKNMGALPNFLFVLDQARGEFFMWAAADDRWDANWIELIYARIYCDRHLAGFGNLVHIDTYAKTLPHLASGKKLEFGRNRLWRKLSFYLAYEGLGKANLFYAIYARDTLRCVNWRGYRYDYQILFALLDQVAYVHVKGASLYKRIHGECEGIGSESFRRLPVILAPVRVLRGDLQIATHYLPSAGPGLKIMLSLLIPIKLLIALRFHVLRSASSLRDKLYL